MTYCHLGSSHFGSSSATRMSRESQSVWSMWSTKSSWRHRCDEDGCQQPQFWTHSHRCDRWNEAEGRHLWVQSISLGLHQHAGELVLAKGIFRKENRDHRVQTIGNVFGVMQGRRRQSRCEDAGLSRSRGTCDTGVFNKHKCERARAAGGIGFPRETQRCYQLA